MLGHLLEQRYFRWLMAILSGLLMLFSFPFTGSLFPLAFIAWVPLLLLEATYAKRRSLALLPQSYLTFLIYNTGTTWWVYNASPDGAYMAFLCNSLLMMLAFYLFHRIKRASGSQWVSFVLPSVWIAFEFFHYHWELSWPWLTLGNVFARIPELVQWYEWTGVFGGTLWILTINLAVYRIIRYRYLEGIRGKTLRMLGIRGLTLLLLPMIVSLLRYATYSEAPLPYEVVVVQPNIDPYNEKFSGSTNNEQLDHIMSLADAQVTPKTRLVVAPETALNPIPPLLNEQEIHQMTLYHQLMERKARWNNAAFLIGATTEKYFDYKHSHASRQDYGGPGFIETYNSSVLFGETRTPQIVHKSKLVLGVEKIPFAATFPQLEELSIKMGGSYGSLGIQDEGPSVVSAEGTGIAPVVCYESIYGGFVARQCRKGAAFIAIITNDGWWGDTPGYRQHFAFARLRAIENRKYVVRSANTGKSGIIDQRGIVVRETSWWKPLAFRETIQLNQEPTLYEMLGDYPAYFAIAGVITFLIMGVFRSFKKQRS